MQDIQVYSSASFPESSTSGEFMSLIMWLLLCGLSVARKGMAMPCPPLEHLLRRPGEDALGAVNRVFNHDSLISFRPNAHYNDGDFQCLS